MAAAAANHGLSEEELAEFREIFNLVDADGSGEISREELGELISTLGLKVTRSIDFNAYTAESNALSPLRRRAKRSWIE